MRRFVFTFAATGLLFVFGPAAALAHHQSRGHHGARAHSHIRRFGDVTSAPTTTSSTDNVGTVASFTGGVLTIQLNDGSTVSGTVANDTAIECASSGQSQSTQDSGDQGSSDSGDQSSGSSDSGDQTSGSSDSGDQSSSIGDQGDQSSSGEDQGDQSSSGEDQGDASSSCSSADLTAGKTVHAAELKITSAGKTWDKVELGA